MPIITGSPYFAAVDELFSGRTGSPYDLSTGHRNYIRRFRVIVRMKEIGSLGVCTCPGLPQPGAPYNSGNGLEHDLLALMVGMNAEQEHTDDWQQWIVTARYSTELPESGIPTNIGFPGGGGIGGLGGGSQNNPEMEPLEIEWDFDIADIYYQKDMNNKPILNSSLQPFKNAPPFRVGRPVLVVTRNDLSFSATIASTYAFAVNSEPFVGAQPGAALCYPPRARQVHRGSLAYWRVTYRIHFLAADDLIPVWDPIFLLDAGTMKLVPIPEEGVPEAEWKKRAVPITRGPLQISHDVPLDGEGNEQVIKPDGTFDQVFKQFFIHKTANFGTLFDQGFIP